MTPDNLEMFFECAAIMEFDRDMTRWGFML